MPATLTEVPRLERGPLGDWIIPDFPPFEPQLLGPTWRRGPDGKFVAPELTLGWQAIKWAEESLRAEKALPGEYEPGRWRFTPEQKRLLLHWYAIDERGVFIWRDGVVQRMKGAGKDPLAAVIALIELLGPCRFAGFAGRDMPEIGVKKGEPVARTNTSAWVQVVGTAKAQTKNTMICFGWLIDDDLKKAYRLQVNRETIFSHGGKRRLEAVTSSPRVLEGNRPSFIVRNEPHHWVESNEGYDLQNVCQRNLDKSPDGSARGLSITNAYDPSEKSVAQNQREAWEAEESGLQVKTGLFYDSIEGPPSLALEPPKPPKPDDMSDDEFAEIYAEMTKKWIANIIRGICGDAYWTPIERITATVLDRRTPASEKKRFWLNTITTVEDAWLAPDAIDASIAKWAIEVRQSGAYGDHELYRAGWDQILPDEEIVMFGDGSKSDDSTGLVGCRLSDGYVFEIGVWQKPIGKRGETWLAPRDAVDRRVIEAFERFNIVAFWFDPSHALDDEDSSRYWDGLIDDWHRRYADRLDKRLWPVKSGMRFHAIMWDMSNQLNQQAFVSAAMQFVEEMENLNDIEKYEPTFEICGTPAMVKHLANARMAPSKFGTTLMKENRESAKKIDLAVCAVGARMLRRAFLNTTVELEEEKGYQVWGV